MGPRFWELVAVALPLSAWGSLLLWRLFNSTRAVDRERQHVAEMNHRTEVRLQAMRDARWVTDTWDDGPRTVVGLRRVALTDDDEWEVQDRVIISRFETTALDWTQQVADGEALADRQRDHRNRNLDEAQGINSL